MYIYHDYHIMIPFTILHTIHKTLSTVFFNFFTFHFPFSFLLEGIFKERERETGTV